jgi:hypothetical protein
MDRSHEPFQELCRTAMGFLVNVGIISSIAGRWPDDVQERWVEKIETVTRELQRETDEAQEFATSYDPDE